MKQFFLRVVKWEHFFLCILIVGTLAMHFAIITNPSELILDENHYVKDARNIVENQESVRQEHPPLAKLLVVTGIEIFGDNPWGWRVLPILFGTAGFILFYFLCRRLDMSRTATNIATFLLALENMTFLQASVAMLDVYYVTLMMAAFLLYASRRYLSSGIGIGLSALAKLNGALAAPVVLMHWIFTRKGRSLWFGLTGLFSVLTFVELMMLLDWIIIRRVSSLIDPVYRIQTMLTMSGSLKMATTDHPALSRPWDWLLSYEPMAFWVSPHYNGAISFTIWALAIPAFAYLVWRAIKGSEAGLFGAAWFFGTYLIWIPASIITNRVTYIYYFYPTVGAVCIGVGLGLAQLVELFRNRGSGKLRWVFLGIVILVLVIHLLSFYVLSPVFNYDYSWFLEMII